MQKGVEIMHLPCPLTPDEQRLKGVALAAAAAEKAKIEAEKKLANEGFKERLSAVESKISDLRAEVSSCTEQRPVETREVRQYATGMVH